MLQIIYYIIALIVSIHHIIELTHKIFASTYVATLMKSLQTFVEWLSYFWK